MFYPPYGNDSKPSWLERFGPKIGIGAVIGAAGFLLGKGVSVPFPKEFWALTAQPTATFAAGAGAITAGYLAFHNGEKGRGLDAQHHRETVSGGRESKLQDRYTAAAKQLGDDHSAIREAGAYAIAALADDWLRHGALIPDPGSAHSQAKTCVHLLCSYLRANRRKESTGGSDPQHRLAQFEHEETAVRSSIIGVLRERTGEWRKQEDLWIADKKLTESARIVLDLNGAHLEKANFEGANLREVRFVKTKLAGANLRKAQLQKAHMLHADLTRARMQNSDLTNSLMANANLTRVFATSANFTGARAIEAIFSDAQLRDANFEGAYLSEVKFNGARASEANFGRSNLREADFSGATLSGTDFTGCTFRNNPTFDDETRYSPSTKWPKGYVPTLGRLVPDRVLPPQVAP